MLFFEIIFEFNFGTVFGQDLLEPLNNENDLGFIKFRTDPDDETSYLVHKGFLLKRPSVIQVYLTKAGGDKSFLDNLLI